jgi:SAM-dependent methyltransferase
VSIEQLRRNWQAFGQQDPLWAICTRPGRRFGQWDLDEFMAMGVAEVAGLMEAATPLGLRPSGGRALDFGCGVGRLTQALAQHVDSVVGIDLADSMIAEARLLNRFPATCDYLVNDRADLARFDDASFDLILTILVLQHMPNGLSEAYLAEFMRVLRPGGLAIFQAPHACKRHEPILADGAHRATLRTDADLREMTWGERRLVRVYISNDSAFDWPQSELIQLGYRWRDHSGAMSTRDAGRGELADPVLAGHTAAVDIMVAAPAAAGRYTLEFDVVEQDVTWFATQGSSSLRLDTTVQAQGPPPAGEEPMMEMHALPRERVLGAIEAAGGRIVQMTEHDDCGPSWTSYRYFATRDEQSISGLTRTGCSASSATRSSSGSRAPAATAPA